MPLYVAPLHLLSKTTRIWVFFSGYPNKPKKLSCQIQVGPKSAIVHLVETNLAICFY